MKIRVNNDIVLVRLALFLLKILDIVRVIVSHAFIYAITLLPLNSYADAKEDFGYSSGAYIASCYGTAHTKEKYCPAMKAEKPQACISNTIQLLPSQYQNEFKRGLPTIMTDGQSHGIDAIESTYLEVLKKNSGNKAEACKVFGPFILAYQFGLFDKMKLIATYMK